MNTWLSWWRADERIAQVLRALLRRGTRLSHHLFSIVGGCAVMLALAVWLLPSWRGTLAARVMPFVSAAVQAGPARLLQGNPLPSFAPPGAKPDDDSLADNAGGPTPTATLADAGTAAAGGNAAGAATLDAVTLNGLDPHALPSVGALARMIPSQRITPDARDDRVLVSEREQGLVSTYLSRRYRVAQEPVGELVKAAFDTGREVGLDPLLLLAVMAIESGFNPYAESGVGAQGLMQVMSKVHSDKFQYFGGQSAALDPLANIKVGALVLKDCIARGGSVPGGLRLYVGSTSQDDGGYGAKVMAERGRLRDVARGRRVSITAPQAPTPAPAATTVSTPVPQHDGRRVQVTLDGAHPLTEKTASSPAKAASEQDDASTAAQKHAQASEMGV
ncbi:lytic transglycosylase domain-containing protein [Paraburkholderia caballeronis]|uniref:lytic transglycosylase domain-containing protein n=1 Tax=Paraburkholderia caballeronis TaxID=416943 RepID=UPI0010664322|nr:lytic transglycosylase domain-containing protein [Paraburkholderia caballeronis]TDV06933.1 soluble lytic murein transglycosylase-like protein [Paraburkholderia caballeronis]TDV10912.1 soluble lytic murein transglycosylase-like protein [Paraburkholderia caballeronis]TDV22350.1 soluble lytic murein transglycosylase-like protein [Paraburkholderia caballeronis]TDV25069.1 soluble lytic murein transglycosylase-like protein [Paraburkholderia caballeronis]